MIRCHVKFRTLLKPIDALGDLQGKRGPFVALASAVSFFLGFVMLGILAAAEEPIASTKGVEEATITFQITCPIKSKASGRHVKEFLGTHWEEYIRFPLRYVMREDGAFGVEYNKNGANKNGDMPLAWRNRCTIPECTFYCEDLKTGFGESRAGSLDAAARGVPPRVRIMHLVNGELHPRVLHVRPSVD